MKKRLIWVFVILIISLFVISSCDSVKASRLRAFGNSCSDSDYGFIYNDPGTVTLTGRGERQSTDYCRNENTLIEYGCTERYGGFIAGSNIVNCANKFGEGSTCQNGACVGGEELVLECGTIIDENFENRKVTMDEDLVCNPEEEPNPIRAALIINANDFVLDCNDYNITISEFDHNNDNNIWIVNLNGIIINDREDRGRIIRRGAIKNCQISGLPGGTAIINDQGITNFEISGNIITGVRRGLDLWDFSSSKIIGNQIINVDGDGFLMMERSNSNVIMNNIINNNLYRGFSISRDTNENIIRENSFCFNGREDIWCGNAGNGRNVYEDNICNNIREGCNNIRCVNRCE